MAFGYSILGMGGYTVPPAAGPTAPFTTSIQYVSITIAAGSTSNTATITSVSTSLSFLVFLGLKGTRTSAAVANKDMARITLTNATTVTASRNTSDASETVTVTAVVIEGTSTLVSSVQYGTVSISASTSGTATITSVDTSKSAVFYLGSTTTGTGTDKSTQACGVTLTNATTVTANVGGSSTHTVGFVVVQFVSNTIQSIQQASTAYTSANATDTLTISSVTVNNTMIAYGGLKTSNTTGGEDDYRIYPSSSTNVNLVRFRTGTTSRTPYYTVIEFASGVFSQAVQHNLYADLNGASTAVVGFTAVSSTKGAVLWAGNNFASATYVTANVFSQVVGFNGVDAADTRRGAATGNNRCGVQVLDFN